MTLTDVVCRGHRIDGSRAGTEETGGTLHPRFVEWMMGFPPGWTDTHGDDEDNEMKPASAPSAMPLFPK